MKLNALAAALTTAFFTSSAADAAPSGIADRNGKPAIVLVHGAYADGSSWSKVIPLLQARGYPVVAVQNPLTSLADDVAATERVINLQTRPVLLVGHSSAGVVITQAGAHPRVKALVYVSAFAPDTGESIQELTAGTPPSPQIKVIKDEGGFLTLSAETIARHFAQDLTATEKGLIAATQGPWAGGYSAERVTKVAWRHKPSWWVLGEKDRMIAPSLQIKMAARIKAKVTKAPTSHLPMLADPKTVAAVIIAAANSVQSGKFGTGASLGSSPVRWPELTDLPPSYRAGFAPIPLAPLP